MSAPAENRLSEDVSRPRVLPGSITSRAVTFSAASATSTEEDVGDLLSLGAALRLDLQSLGQRLLHSQKQPTDEGPFFGALPEEILLQILSYLDLPSLGRFVLGSTSSTYICALQSTWFCLACSVMARVSTFGNFCDF